MAAEAVVYTYDKLKRVTAITGTNNTFVTDVESTRTPAR